MQMRRSRSCGLLKKDMGEGGDWGEPSPEIVLTLGYLNMGMIV